MTVDHESWDELLAAHALDALDPDERRELEQHAVTCATCRERLAEFEAVAADLARALSPVAPPPDGKARLRAALARSERPPGNRTPIAPQRRTPASAGPPARTDGNRPGGGRGRRVSRTLLAAMTGVVLLAAAVGYGLHERHVASQRNSALATAERLLRGIAAGQRTVTMHSQGQRHARGQVVQSDGHVWFVADGLARNDRSTSIYVLWASTPQGKMAPVATFDVGKDGFAMVNGAALPRDAAAVPGFAVSHESGRTAPPSPSTPLLRSQA